MPRRFSTLACAVLALLVACCSTGGWAEEAPQRLLIAAASDLQFALPEVIAAFSRAQPSVEVKVTYGSSGTLVAQIENGAPFDMFLSADVALPQRLVKEGHAGAESVFSYAEGHVVLWVPTASPLDLPRLGVRAVLEPTVRKVAMANPKVAPYGAAAEGALQRGKVYAEVKRRLVLGENVAQAAQFVASGAADIGLISLSFARSPKMKDAGRHWQLPVELCPPLEQSGVILQRTRNRAQAESFRVFLLGTGGREILQRHGFTVPPPPAR